MGSRGQFARSSVATIIRGPCPPSNSKLVILGAQTQEDPVDPIALDEDPEVGSDHTESIDTRGGTSDAAGEAEVVSGASPNSFRPN